MSARTMRFRVEKIERALLDRGDEGLTRTDIRNVLGSKSIPSSDIDEILSVIENSGIASPEKVGTKGRSAEVWRRNDGSGKAATEWLATLLAGGVRLTLDHLKSEAAQAGLSWRTVERSASNLGVVKERGAMVGDCGTWTLSESNTTQHSPALATPTLPPVATLSGTVRDRLTKYLCMTEPGPTATSANRCAKAIRARAKDVAEVLKEMLSAQEIVRVGTGKMVHYQPAAGLRKAERAGVPRFVYVGIESATLQQLEEARDMHRSASDLYDAVIAARRAEMGAA